MRVRVVEALLHGAAGLCAQGLDFLAGHLEAALRFFKLFGEFLLVAHGHRAHAPGLGALGALLAQLNSLRRDRRHGRRRRAELFAHGLDRGALLFDEASQPLVLVAQANFLAVRPGGMSLEVKLLVRRGRV